MTPAEEIAHLREQERNRWHEVQLYQERNRELQAEVERLRIVEAAIDRLTRAVLTFSLMHAALMPSTQLNVTGDAMTQLAALDAKEKP